MKADAKTETEVMSVLNRLAETYEKRSLDDLLALFALGPDVILIGSGADERRIGIAEIKAQAKRDWSQSEAASWEYEWTLVSKAGTVSWLAVAATFQLKVGGQETSLPGRLTAVLEKRGDK